MPLGTRHKEPNMYTKPRCVVDMTRYDAAIDLNMSNKTLYKYELGQAIPPPEAVYAMSEVYRDPFLAAKHCSEVCPIGRAYAYPVEKKDLAMAALDFIKEYKDIGPDLLDKLVIIARDNKIVEEERETFLLILAEMADVARVVQEIKLLAVGILSEGKEKTALSAVQYSRLRPITT